MGRESFLGQSLVQAQLIPNRYEHGAQRRTKIADCLPKKRVQPVLINGHEILIISRCQ
jgi:hypothetical protein